MKKEKILLFALSILAMVSFALPFFVSNIQNSLLVNTVNAVEIDAYKSEIVEEITINDTDDLSIIYEIITLGTKSLQNITAYTDEMPADIYILVNEEIEYLQNQFILPKTEFHLLDTPTLLRYDSQLNGSILVWEYYFYDEEENILKLLYHSKTDKILSLDYENTLIKNDNNWEVEYYSPYITEPNAFNYMDSRKLYDIFSSPLQILKTQIRLFDTGYAVTVHKK